MKQFFTLVFLVISLVGYTQTKHFVGVGNNFFNPKVLNINQGDTVVWQNQQGFHNVNGSTGIYPANPVSFTNGGASSAAWTYQFIFTTPGKYDYQCDPHAGVGMTGVVNVAPITSVFRIDEDDVLKQTLFKAGQTLTLLDNSFNKVEIYSLNGTKVAEYKSSDNMVAPSLNGIYVITVLREDNVKTYKIAVQ